VKLHPLTAVRDALAYGSRAASFGVFAALIASSTGAVERRLAFGAAAAFVLAGATYGVARYLAFEYELDATTLSITSGVLRRRAREIPLERVQNVDVEQSLVGRLFGLAVVRFETAGGGSTEGELRLVGVERAHELQGELRRRKRAVEAAPGEAVPGEPDPELLYELSPGGLALLSAVSFRWGAIPLVLFSTPFAEDLLLRALRRYVVGVVLGGELSLADPRLLGVGVGAVGGLLLAAWVVSMAITVLRYHRFRLVRLDDELRYERGLGQRYSGTVPLEKVQSLVVEENVAMRRLGYAALTVETAGYAPGGGGDSGRSPSAVPLAPRGTVLELVAALEDVDDLAVERPPPRARRRYAGRYALAVAALAAVFAAVHAFVLPLGVLWAVPAAGLVAALPAAHLKWANRGHRTGPDHAVMRSGVWRRATRVVPYYRLQTVFTERTVFQRRFDLASVVADTAASSGLGSAGATAHDIDDGDARALHRELVERFRADIARRRAGRRPRRRRWGGEGSATVDGDGPADGADATAGNGTVDAGDRMAEDGHRGPRADAGGQGDEGDDGERGGHGWADRTADDG